MRLFIAIELSDEVKAALQASQRMLSAFDRTVRWVTEQQMHLTLKFLGEVADDAVEEINVAAELVAEASSPFEMVVAGSGCFPPRGRVRVVWAGVEESSGVLAACGERCEARYAEIGFDCERRAFSPHLTLGRVREDRTAGKLREAVDGVSIGPLRESVAGLCVFQSTLTPQGARYAIISRHPFGGS